MTYTHGATRNQPAATLSRYAASIAQARAHLCGLSEQVAAAKAAADAARQIAVKERLKRGVAYTPMTPEQFRAEAERSYEYAMKTHPENATEGKRRLAEVMAEAYEIHQEAA